MYDRAEISNLNTGPKRPPRLNLTSPGPPFLGVLNNFYFMVLSELEASMYPKMAIFTSHTDKRGILCLGWPSRSGLASPGA